MTCPHDSVRWLDCEACRDAGETCPVLVCVECGASIPAEEVEW